MTTKHGTSPSGPLPPQLSIELSYERRPKALALDCRWALRCSRPRLRAHFSERFWPAPLAVSQVAEGTLCSLTLLPGRLSRSAEGGGFYDAIHTGTPFASRLAGCRGPCGGCFSARNARCGRGAAGGLRRADEQHVHEAARVRPSRRGARAPGCTPGDRRRERWHTRSWDPGYDASVDYVVDTLEAAGWTVELDEFDFTFVGADSPADTDRSLVPDRCVHGERPGTVTGHVIPVDINLTPPRASDERLRGG